MLNKEDWMYITTQRDKGVYMKDIAEGLGQGTKKNRDAAIAVIEKYPTYFQERMNELL